MIDKHRFLAALIACALAAPTWAADNPYRAPRTAHGAPQLEGLWTTATYTQLERPKEFKALVATPEEARRFEARLATTGGVDIPREFDTLGQADSEFPEAGSGLTRIGGEIRSSHIVEPADGKLPWTEAGKKDVSSRQGSRQRYDNPEDRPHNERCLSDSSTGAPILSAEDANVLQILQTRDHVVVLTEKYHDARVIRLSGAPADTAPPSWLGESTGRWEGDTLVVHTKNVRPGLIGRGNDLHLSGQSEVVERFTRIGPKQIFYAFTVTDPYLFSRPWKGEMIFGPSPGRWFPYDCHEGNYSLVNILAAAREGNQPSPKPPEQPKVAAAP